MSAATVVFLLLGFVALTAGGEILVRGAGALARSFGLSSFVIGLTVVSFATSAPELAVTLQAALSGTPGLAVGNVVGSNIANVLLILGICAVVLPLAVRSQIIRLDIPAVVAVSVLTLLLALDGTISRASGLVLVFILVAYVAVSMLIGRRRAGQDDTAVDARSPGTRPAPSEVPRPGVNSGARGATGLESSRAHGTADVPRIVPTKQHHPLVSILFVVVGVGFLVVGARLLVSGATDIASALGVSDLVIGLTVVAIGTSLPELAASLIAALRGERELAVGNIVGSCFFNIGAVLGLTAALTPGGIPVAPAAVRLDLPIMIAVVMALIPVAFTGFTVARWEGAMFVAYYAAYVAYVLLDATGHDAVEPFSGVMLGFVIPITVLWLALLVAYELGLRRGRREPAVPGS